MAIRRRGRSRNLGTTPTPFPPPSCGVTVLTHNGGVQRYAYVDDVTMSMAAAFCDGRAASGR